MNEKPEKGQITRREHKGEVAESGAEGGVSAQVRKERSKDSVEKRGRRERGRDQHKLSAAIKSAGEGYAIMVCVYPRNGSLSAIP